MCTVTVQPLGSSARKTSLHCSHSQQNKRSATQVAPVTTTTTTTKTQTAHKGSLETCAMKQSLLSRSGTGSEMVIAFWARHGRWLLMQLTLAHPDIPFSRYWLLPNAKLTCARRAVLRTQRRRLSSWLPVFCQETTMREHSSTWTAILLPHCSVHQPSLNSCTSTSLRTVHSSWEKDNNEWTAIAHLWSNVLRLRRSWSYPPKGVLLAQCWLQLHNATRSKLWA